MLVSISDYMNQHLKDILPATDIRTLAHCYDEDSFADKTHCPIDNCFRLVSMGIVRTRDGFGDHEKLSTLLTAVAELRQEGVDVSHLRLRFVGQKLELVQALAARYGCDDLLELPGAVTHDEAMQELVQATCLFYIQTEFGTRRRLTECIGARRPILAYPDYPGTFSNQLLDDYGAARIAHDKQGLKKHLRQLLEQFTSKKALELPVNQATVAEHSAGRRAAEFAALLEQVVPTPASA
jgi:glycosyltransferase involved in cell wall biosynthesis